MGGEQVTGPRAYFPSIEKRYGQPISHWMTILAADTTLRHSDMVAKLKSEHGLGHGHANALVAQFRADHAL